MGDSSLNDLIRYWTLLSPEQKQSLIAVIQSFLPSPGNEAQQLQEPESFYGPGNDKLAAGIFEKLNGEQKQSLMALMESFDIDTGESTSIEAYNKELDEAEAAFEKGDFYTHEEVLAMLKKWTHGR